jgi:acyl-coenzyme A synthetase/AMP-(fatty) acid ligase
LAAAQVVADVQRAATQRLASYKRPRTVTVVDALPRDEAGKLLRRVLRDRLREPTR